MVLDVASLQVIPSKNEYIQCGDFCSGKDYSKVSAQSKKLFIPPESDQSFFYKEVDNISSTVKNMHKDSKTPLVLQILLSAYAVLVATKGILVSIMLFPINVSISILFASLATLCLGVGLLPIALPKIRQYQLQQPQTRLEKHLDANPNQAFFIRCALEKKITSLKEIQNDPNFDKLPKFLDRAPYQAKIGKQREEELSVLEKEIAVFEKLREKLFFPGVKLSEESLRSIHLKLQQAAV